MYQQFNTYKNIYTVSLESLLSMWQFRVFTYLTGKFQIQQTILAPILSNMKLFHETSIDMPIMLEVIKTSINSSVCKSKQLAKFKE
jgi:hypothetical protein